MMRARFERKWPRGRMFGASVRLRVGEGWQAEMLGAYVHMRVLVTQTGTPHARLFRATSKRSEWPRARPHARLPTS